MRIAILMGHARYTGVNTWISDLAVGLGADIIYLPIDSIDPEGTFIHDGMLEHGVFSQRPLAYYDVLIVSYREHLDLLTDKKAESKILYVIHGRGVYAGHYSLTGSRAKIDALVAVSEYVNQDVQCDVVIPHGVDTKVFNTLTTPINHEFLWHSRYAIPYKLIKLLGNKVVRPSQESDSATILRYIRSSKYVIGIGRSALEALACGKPTFSWAGAYGNDHSRMYGGYYDGWIGEENFDELSRSNFNGTVSHGVFSSTEEIEASLKFDDKFERVSQDLSADTMSARYMKLIEEIT